MDGVTYKKFVYNISEDNRVYHPYGFACDNYISKYDVKPEQTEGYYVFGAIICDNDMYDEFYPHMFRFIKKLMRHDEELVMVVLDIYHATDEFCKMIRDELDGAYGYEELKNVYETGIVFARKV